MKDDLPENVLTEKIIGAAIEVHRALGPGLLESAYEACLAHELGLRQIPFERQKVFQLTYKGLTVPEAYRADLVVDNAVVVEIKAVSEFHPVHTAQTLTYLKLAELRLGLLINFNQTKLLPNGVKRLRL